MVGSCSLMLLVCRSLSWVLDCRGYRAVVGTGRVSGPGPALIVVGGAGGAGVAWSVMEDPALEPADFDTMRVGYGLHPRLDVADLGDDWLPLLTTWLDEAARRGVREPNAMVLATVGADGRPSTRTVLCKGVDDDGLTFFTTTTSRKGSQLAVSGYASVTFSWPVVERQINLEGECRPLGRDECLAYWRTRPRGSQIAAWASEQSRPAESVEQLEALFAAARRRFADVDQIPMPDRWGGYRLEPDRVEFWQGGRDRFHDRVVCNRTGDRWSGYRLQP